MAADQDLWDLVASHREGVLATIASDGRPQLSNVLYATDPSSRMLRISTTADRVKARNLGRDPRASLHVGGEDFWHFAVAEGTTTLSDVAAAPGDDATRKLLQVHSSFYGTITDEDTFFAEMIANRRLVVQLVVEHLYGVMATGGRRPQNAPSG